MQGSSQKSLIFKVVSGGAGGVGKTTFFHRYTSNVFLANTIMTVGVNFHSKNLSVDEKLVKLFVWDLGGQPRFRFMQDSYIRGSLAGMVFFDISNPTSIAEVPYWVEEFRSKGMPSMPLILVGTKLDMASPENEAKALKLAKVAIDQFKFSFYMPTSSKLNVNVSEVFEHLMGLLLGKLHGPAGEATQEIRLAS